MKVGIVYPYFAHYRKPILEELNDDQLFDYYFLGGTIVGSQFEGMKLTEFPNSKKFIRLKNRWFLKYFLVQPDLLSKLKKNGFDSIIVFADWKYLSTWQLLFYCKARGIPVLFWTHGFRTNTNSLNSIIKLLYFNLFDGGFVYDTRAKNIFIEKRYKNKIEVIYNSLDFSLQSKIYKKSLLDDNLFKRFGNYIVFSGRLTHTKKLDLLIDALSILKSQNIKINAVLIGDGQYRTSLIEYAAKSGVSDQVVFYGSCYDEDVIANCYINSVVCVIPSAVGLSAIHSLTYGTPVLTNNNLDSHGPEIESVVENLTGKFFIEHDAISLAEGIKYFSSLTDVERDKYCTNSISMVKEKFNPRYQRFILNRRLLEIFNKNE